MDVNDASRDAVGMWLLPALTAPVVMLLALQAQRRLGPEAAGLVGALPMTMPIAVLAVAASLGDPGASAFALAAATHVPAQVVFGVVFAAVMRRRGPLRGLAAGVASFAAASWAISFIPTPEAVILAVPALAAGPVLLGRWRGDRSAVAAKRPGSVLTCAAGALVVAAVLGSVRLGGPVAGGLFAALPALSATLAIAVARSSGQHAGADAASGMVRGLPVYFAFVLATGLLASTIGTLPAVATGLSASVAIGVVTWRRDSGRPSSWRGPAGIDLFDRSHVGA